MEITYDVSMYRVHTCYSFPDLEHHVTTELKKYPILHCIPFSWLTRSMQLQSTYPQRGIWWSTQYCLRYTSALCSAFNPELTQLNQDFHNRYKLGLILPRNCHNLTRIFSLGIYPAFALLKGSAYGTSGYYIIMLSTCVPLCYNSLPLFHHSPFTRLGDCR